MEGDMGLQSLSVGGENRYARSLLGPVKRVNLTLRRAVVAPGNAFAKWCESTFESGLGTSPVKRDIRVTLQDANGVAAVVWVFRAAWPVRWSADLVGPGSNDLAIESVVLAYKSVERSLPQPRAGQ